VIPAAGRAFRSLAAHRAPGTPSPAPGGGGLIGPFLRDPGGYLRHLLDHAREIVLAHGLALAVPVLAAAVLATGARYGLARWRHAWVARGARQVTIMPPPKVDPSGALVLWAGLTGLLRPAWRRLLEGQPHVAFEYVWSAHVVEIRMWVPGQVPPGLVERAVEAAWPGARTLSPPLPPLPAGSLAAGGLLRLARPGHLPLRTDHPADPQRALMGAASGLAPGQHAYVGVLARPVTGRRLRRAHRAAAALRGGQPAPPLGRLFDLITPLPRPAASANAYAMHPERAGQVRAILDKAAHSQWETEIRYGVAAEPGPTPPGQVRRALRGRAHALAATFALFAGHNYLRRQRVRRPAAAFAARPLRHGDLLSVPELAALAHLPLDGALPGLSRAGANAVPPPPVVPVPGPAAKPLGVSDAGAVRPVGLAVADARHHLHVLGATGSGKSTLLAHMILADATARRGAVVIDPKGDLINDVLSRLPEEAAGRVVLFDPGERHGRPGLNVLHGPDRDLAVDNLVGIFRRIYAEFWGPRTDEIMRSACLTLWNAPAATLADVPRLLSDPAYRGQLTARLRDPILRGFWTWYDALSDAARAHATGPVLNKVRAFLLRDFVRATIGTAASTVDLARVLDHGGLCLVRVPKGMLGADASCLFGSLVVAKVWESVSHRARLPEARRADCALYIDECHNFLNLPHGLADLLAEARAYRLSVTLAHQNLTQLPRDLREAISANARSKLYFTVSPEDSRDLERHVAPGLSAHDLAHLGGFQAAARLIASSTETPAFTLRTQPLPPPVPGRAQLIRTASRDTYGRHAAAPGRAAALPAGDPRIPNATRSNPA
jgi:Helicase HerA, central domain/TraM recognition site of TraD and TraG